MMKMNLMMMLLSIFCACVGAPATVVGPGPLEHGEWFVVEDASLETRSWAISKKTGEKIDLAARGTCTAGLVEIAVLDEDCPVGQAWPPKRAWRSAGAAPLDGSIPGASGRCVGVKMRKGLCLAARRRSAAPRTQWWIKNRRWCDMSAEVDQGCSPNPEFEAEVER